MQAQPYHHQDGQQQEGDHAHQAGRQQGICQCRPPTWRVAHGCIKAGRYGGVVTPNRGIDEDFLDLPRQQLADAALSAAAT
ncbi:hypothetical protein FVP32_13370, partial [Mycobacterium tuberculosis]|nr:hypothetical protein [Mycobacterium tuberculosis]